MYYCSYDCDHGNVNHSVFFSKIGLAVGDIEAVSKNARLKRLAMQVIDCLCILLLIVSS